MIIFFTVLLIAAVCATLAWIWTQGRRCVQSEPSLACIRETPVTIIFGLLLWTEAAVLLRLSPDTSAYTPAFQRNIFAFLLVSILLGAFLICYARVKRILVYADRITRISVRGIETSMRWDDIVHVTLTQNQRIRLSGNDGRQLVVGGSKKGMNAFVALALLYLEDAEGKKTLESLVRRS